MKKTNHYLLLLTVLLFLPFMQSCNDDNDDSANDPTPITYPHTITFSHFENIEFKMWTNGAEVNTTGLDFLDFVVDDDDLSYLSSEYYQSGTLLTFTEDSVFGLTSLQGTIEGYPYAISNDSIYALEVYSYPGASFGHLFLGLGSPSELRLPQSFAQFLYSFDDGNMTSFESYKSREFQTLETALEEFDIPSVAYIEEGDTLFLNNRYVHYK